MTKFLAAAVALTTAVDVIFSLQVTAETSVDWGWLDALWLFTILKSRRCSVRLIAKTINAVARSTSPNG
ncbi:MAG: hypothetical protein LC739_06475 [Actinobacteria bacterium]|nr:hypothetical protein [Actinomycetota bacterium]